MRITRFHDSVIGSRQAVRSERVAPWAPGCLDVDDNGLDWAVVDVMMRHQVQGQRPKLGHIEQRLGGRIPRSEGENPGKGRRNGHAANSETCSSDLDLLSPLLPGEVYWWNFSYSSSVQAQGSLELQVGLPLSPY